MANIDHNLIEDPYIHEPKGVATALTKQVYVADGAASGTWKKIQETDIDYSVAANNRHGYNEIYDSAHPIGAPLVISSGTKTKLTNNGSGAGTDTTRLGGIWDAGLGELTFDDEHSVYLLSFTFKCTTSSPASSPYALRISMESANPGVTNPFWAESVFILGGNYVNDISVHNDIIIDSDLVNYANTIYVTPSTGVSIYDVEFQITRLYTETN